MTYITGVKLFVRLYWFLATYLLKERDFKTSVFEMYKYIIIYGSSRYIYLVPDNMDGVPSGRLQ